MVIVLEGFDTTGKSSLAHYLAYKLNLYYMHSMPSYSKELYMELIETLDRIKEDVVIDRFHLTDMVYGKVVCEHTRINKIQCEKLEGYMLKRGIIFIHCTAKLEIVKERYMNEKSRYVPSQLIDVCLREYYEQFERLKNAGFLVYKLNTSQPFEIQKQHIDCIIGQLKGMQKNGK